MTHTQLQPCSKWYCVSGVRKERGRWISARIQGDGPLRSATAHASQHHFRFSRLFLPHTVLLHIQLVDGVGGTLLCILAVKTAVDQINCVLVGSWHYLARALSIGWWKN